MAQSTLWIVRDDYSYALVETTDRNTPELSPELYWEDDSWLTFEPGGEWTVAQNTKRQRYLLGELCNEHVERICGVELEVGECFPIKIEVL